MVFPLGLRHTFRVWKRGLALVQSIVMQTPPLRLGRWHTNPLLGDLDMPGRDDRWFTTQCGRDVALTAIHIRSFDHGYLEGETHLIRYAVLKRLKDTAKQLLPGTSAVYVDPLSFSADDYPALIYFCDFTCYDAIGPGADCSSLTTIWFADDLSQTIPAFLTPRMRSVSWVRYAADGYW